MRAASPTGSSRGSSSSLYNRGSNRMVNVLLRMRRNLRKVVVGVERFAQRRQTVKNSRLHRSQRTLQNHGDLLVAQPFAEPQHQGLSLPVGQVGDLGPQALLPLRRLPGPSSMPLAPCALPSFRFPTGLGASAAACRIRRAARAALNSAGFHRAMCKSCCGRRIDWPAGRARETSPGPNRRRPTDCPSRRAPPGGSVRSTVGSSVRFREETRVGAANARIWCWDRSIPPIC